MRKRPMHTGSPEKETTISNHSALREVETQKMRIRRLKVADRLSD